MTTVDDDQTMLRSNLELIGRDKINDLEAVLNFVGKYDVEGYHRVPDNCPAEFTWDYEKGAKPQLDKLYEKAKKAQWNGQTDLDWSIEVDQEKVVIANAEANPAMTQMDPASFAGTVLDTWDEKRFIRFGIENQNWMLSQFMHGEQGALLCTAKIVETVPWIDAKYYAATQVMDEARHVETYSRYLDKIETAYPINPNLKSLLDDVLSDSRWDMTYLGMQILIEGLALAAFGLIRNTAGDPLGKAVNAYVMQDEARHVMFGRLALRDYYPQLSQAERDDREEFCADACYRMRDRFLGEELWQCLGYDPEDCLDYVNHSESQQVFRSLLFTRIVPTLKDVGLWGPKMRQTFADMGVIGYESTDLDAVMAEDESIAEEVDVQQRAAMDAAIADGVAAAT